ncbi:MAG: hypothetical protein Q8M77_05245 [Hydrogenophaga sp.]|nr:hypothetical protein [Hydrogenophaga sp.]
MFDSSLRHQQIEAPDCHGQGLFLCALRTQTISAESSKSTTAMPKTSRLPKRTNGVRPVVGRTTPLNTPPTFRGRGDLEPSKAGVLAISSTRLDLALISEKGQVQWKLAVCPAGVSAQCAVEAKEQGRLSFISTAMTDEAGNAWITDKTNAMFLFRRTGDPVRQFGNLAPCIAPIKGNSSAQAPSPVCVGWSERLVRLDDGRYLIYRREENLSARYVMTLEREQPSRIRFLPMATDMADLPLADRQAIFQSIADLRVWGFDEGRAAPAGRSQWNLGVPTSHGIATASKMMRKYLSQPGAISTAEEVKLSTLFDPPSIFDPGAHSMARMGLSSVVIKDRRTPPTQIAHYDMQTQELRQGIEIRGLPTATSCGLSNTSLEYVFNDDTDALYLFREWTGEVFAIDPSYEAKFLARLPEAQSPNAIACGAATVAGVRVPLAARTPNGNLVIATHQGVFVRRGAVFERVEAPDQVVQLVVLNDTEALVIAKGGLARLRLPT